MTTISTTLTTDESTIDDSTLTLEESTITDSATLDQSRIVDSGTGYVGGGGRGSGVEPSE